MDWLTGSGFRSSMPGTRQSTNGIECTIGVTARKKSQVAEDLRQRVVRTD